MCLYFVFFAFCSSVSFFLAFVDFVFTVCFGFCRVLFVCLLVLFSLVFFVFLFGLVSFFLSFVLVLFSFPFCLSVLCV